LKTGVQEASASGPTLLTAVSYQFGKGSMKPTLMRAADFRMCSMLLTMPLSSDSMKWRLAFGITLGEAGSNPADY
jgi:hypothetical protein